MFLASRENLTKSLGGTAPSGTAPVAVISTSCVPPSASVTPGNYNFGMALVEIGSVRNMSSSSNSTNSNRVYYDYTVSSCLTSAFTTDLVVANNPQSIKLANEGTNAGKYSAWIDYNNDGSFSSSELVVADEIIGVGSFATPTERIFNFTIPTTGVTLDIPLRMRVVGDSNESSTTPCGQLQYGEVEDYSVVLKANALSVEDFVSKPLISPNPSLGIVNINYDKNISEVTVINVSGQSVLNKKYNKSNITLDINHLSPAIYFIRITSENRITTQKIIKE
jgi:hypothetical protein